MLQTMRGPTNGPAVPDRLGLSSALAVPELSSTWHVDSERRRTVLVAAIAAVGTVGSALLLVATSGLSAFLVSALLVVAAIAWRPQVGLCLVLGLSLIFEYLTEDPLMLPGRYLYSGLGGSVISPIELLILLSLGAWLVRGILSRGLEFRGGRLRWPMLLFSIALVLGLLRGLGDGGAAYVALWEVRFLLYIVGCYFLATNTIRTRRDLRILTGVLMLGTVAYALEGVYRKVVLIDRGMLLQDPEDAWGHDSAVFISNLLLLILAQRVFGGPTWQRRLGPFLVPILLFTLLASQRRAANVTLLVSIMVFALVFLVVNRRAFLLLMVPLFLSAAIYFPLFWNSGGMLGQPARAVRSMISPDPRDLSSNYYREIEKINVRATIVANPVFGVGFGREFLMVIPLADLSFWPFWRYEPHNNILWVWLKLGAFGFAAFWALFGTAIAWGANLTKTLTGPEERAFALFAVGAIISSLVFCWVDTGLTFPRFTAILGTILGTLAVLDQIENGGAPATRHRPTHW